MIYARAKKATFATVSIILIALVLGIVLLGFPRDIYVDARPLPYVIIGEDRSPFFIKLRVKGVFNSIQDVQEYIQARQRALSNLARGSEELEVQASFMDLSLDDALDLLQKYRFKAIYEIQLWGFDAQGKYLFTIGKDLVSEGKAIELASFKQELDGFLDKVKAHAHKLVVNFVRGKISSYTALGLQKDPAVILVDPLTDIEMMFQGRALRAVIEGMPDVGFYLRFFQGRWKQ